MSLISLKKFAVQSTISHSSSGFEISQAVASDRPSPWVPQAPKSQFEVFTSPEEFAGSELTGKITIVLAIKVASAEKMLNCLLDSLLAGNMTQG